jgi:DNA-binding SARP family transcriptional activator/tetratricopeptide (TPR) repeat protein
VQHPACPPGLRLQLLRDPQLIRADGAATPLNGRDAALLAVLAVDGPTSREQVLAWLWPDVGEPARARNMLRQRLFRLRRLAGGELVSSGEVLALDTAVRHDLLDLEAMLDDDPAQGAAGELLGALAFPGCDDFTAWLDAARERWRHRRADRLAAMSERHEADDRIVAALACAHRLAAEEPLAEHAQRRLMRLHYRRGDRAAALAVHAQLANALRAELGSAPSSETQSLVALIEGSGALPVAPAPLGPSLLRPPQLIGREAAWQALAEVAVRGRTAWLTGEPGIGKTRLATDHATRRGMPMAGARPGDSRVPYSLLARLLRALARGPNGLAMQGDEVRAELARLLPELGAPPAGALVPARLLAALESTLDSAAPCGVVLDDLQFADDATLELLPSLVHRGGWVLCLREHEVPEVLRAWRDRVDASAFEPIALRPLDAAEVRALLHSLALPDFDVAAWAPRVHRRSGGNPLFVLESLRVLMSAAGPAAPERAWPMPASLQLLIERRLAQLPPPALKLAQVAALALPDFDVDLAAAVLGGHALDLAEPWRELEAAQVMLGDRFAHDLVFEAVRDAVPAVLQRWLHGRIAQALAQRDAPPQRLGIHWRDAGEPARAAACFERAAAACAGSGRLAEQGRWLDAAIDAWDLAGQRREAFDARIRRVIAAREASSPQASQWMAEQLLADAADDRERGLALLQVGSCHSNAIRFQEALACFEAAIAAALAAGDLDTVQHAGYRQGLALAQVQGYAVALQKMESLLPWAEAHADASMRHCFVADLAILYDQSDQRQRARPLFDRALGYFDSRRESGNAAPTRMMFARSLLMLGDLAAAREQAESSVRERAELSEGQGGDGIEVLNLGRIYIELGHYAAALQILEPSRVRLAECGATAVQAATTLVLARAWVHLGQPARARQLLQQLPPDLPFHQKAALHWTRSLLLHERPRERQLALDAALAEFEGFADLPFLRLPMAFDRLACEPGAAALQALRAGVAECQRRELRAPQMLGRLRLLQVLTAMGRRRDALTVACSLQRDLPGSHPVACYLPELHLACRQAAQAAGDEALARAWQELAMGWLARVSKSQVPEACRESFAHRNPVNRAILTATLG